jgi:hypothetical protein
MDTLYDRDVYGSKFREVATVRVITLDDVFAQAGVDRCDLLKLDCEGAEYDVLCGAAPATLARISYIAAEWHIRLNDHDPAELEALLADNGFQLQRYPPLDAEGGHLHAYRP